MALDLFKRVESRKGLFAVEKITLIYNLLLTVYSVATTDGPSIHVMGQGSDFIAWLAFADVSLPVGSM